MHMPFRGIFRTGVTVLFVIITLTIPGRSKNSWPCYHGKDRSNCSADTGLLKQWPPAGPRLLWVATGLGRGISSVAVVDGRIYTAGSVDKETMVIALDSTGNILWRSPNGRSWETDRPWARMYEGAKGTPTVADGTVYHLGETGRLTAFDAMDGRQIWTLNLMKEFGAQVPQYGYTESVIVEHNRLYCRPGGKKGYVACIDAIRGKPVWATTGITGTAAFSSGITAETGGYPQYIGQSSDCVFGVCLTNGKLLWHEEFANDPESNVTDPVVVKDFVLVSTGYGRGSMLLKLSPDGNNLQSEIVWDTTLMDNHHDGVIYHDGYLYGSGHRVKGWACIDFTTGVQMWLAEGKGSLTYADGMLYCLEENGLLKLVTAVPDSCEVKSAFLIPNAGPGPFWTHPVVCNGILYIRHADKIYAYDVCKE